jgi:hypothetical protein
MPMNSGNGARSAATEAWTAAGRALGIEVVAPFRFACDGREHECIAWLADFGGGRGIVLVGTSPPDFAIDRVLKQDASHEGFQWSALDLRSYAEFQREKFMEALLDWGFVGPKERRPPWLDGDVAQEFRLRQAAEVASQQYATTRGWTVQQTVLGASAARLPGGEWAISVRILLRGGQEHCFEYREHAGGTGELRPVDAPRS